MIGPWPCWISDLYCKRGENDNFLNVRSIYDNYDDDEEEEDVDVAAAAKDGVHCSGA